MAKLRALKYGQRSKAVRELQSNLIKLGWPLKVDGHYGKKTREAVYDFKRGFAFWNIGNENGEAFGLLARAALAYSLKRGGKASSHFYFRQFKSKGNGWIKVHRSLLRGLEKMVKKGQNTHIVSGYRDPFWNDQQGGAGNSQHKYGNAADLDELLPAGTVRKLKVFSGIGIQASNGRVRHVDVRHLGPNTTGGTPSKPTIWYY